MIADFFSQVTWEDVTMTTVLRTLVSDKVCLSEEVSLSVFNIVILTTTFLVFQELMLQGHQQK